MTKNDLLECRSNNGIEKVITKGSEIVKTNLSQMDVDQDINGCSNLNLKTNHHKILNIVEFYTVPWTWEYT